MKEDYLKGLPEKKKEDQATDRVYRIGQERPL
jgi:hypothetical protein